MILNIYAALVLFLLTDAVKATFEVGIEFDEVYKSEYDDLENPTTILFVNRIKDAVSASFDLDSISCICAF